MRLLPSGASATLRFAVSVALCAVLPASVIRAQLPEFPDDTAGDITLALSARATPNPIRPGEYARLAIEVAIPGSWYIYSLHLDGHQGLATRVVVKAGDFQILPERFETPPVEELDRFSGSWSRIHKGQARFWLHLQAKSGLSAGSHPISGYLAYAVCNGDICLPEQRAPFRVDLDVEMGKPRAKFGKPGAEP